MKPDAAYWIEQLQLTKHPEGGWFKETYRSAFSFPGEHLPAAFHGDRNFCTCIYFLLEKDDFSALHCIASDELWHFYSGDPLIVYELEQDGYLKEHKLGNDPSRGESFQAVIAAGSWFGAKPSAAHFGYTLAGCTVSPGFDFEDFKLAERAELTGKYPQHSKLIASLTR